MDYKTQSGKMSGADAMDMMMGKMPVMSNSNSSMTKSDDYLMDEEKIDKMKQAEMKRKGPPAKSQVIC